MDDEIIYDWEKPAPHTSLSEAPSANVTASHVEASEAETVQARYSNGYIKSGDFMKDLWEMPGNEFTIVRESLPEGALMTEENVLPILEKHWRDVAEGNNPFERNPHTGFEDYHRNVGLDDGENVSQQASEERELTK